MMTQLPYDLSKARRKQALTMAEKSRLRRARRQGEPDPYATGVIDALGHGLIAIGNRLVSEPDPHPRGHRAA